MSTDTKRLDWIVTHKVLIHTSLADGYWVVYTNGTTSDNRETFRNAIDIAMADHQYIDGI